MPQRSTDAINRARRKFARSRIALRRGVKKELDALARSYARLEAAFLERARDREAQAMADHAFTLEQAEGDLVQLGKQLAALKGLKDAGLSATARAILAAAEDRAAAVRRSRSVYESAVRMANEADQLLRQFNHRLLAEALAALEDEAAVDRTIALLAGGTILGGLVVAPVTFAVADIGLLVADVKKRWAGRALVAASDREALRVEIAGELIGAIRKQQERWLRIFRAHG